MSRRAGKARRVRGALLALGALFLSSGIIRLADGTGRALAREVEMMSAGRAEAQATEPQARPGCTTEDGLAKALAQLRARSEALDEQEEKIEHRMVTLQRAEEKIQEDLAALIAAEEALEATIALADGAAAEDIARLTSVYERMKPKEAAAVFDAMDPSFAAGFLARMRPDVVAAIMSGLSPTRAYAVSVLLAGRNAAVPTE